MPTAILNEFVKDVRARQCLEVIITDGKANMVQNTEDRMIRNQFITAILLKHEGEGGLLKELRHEYRLSLSQCIDALDRIGDIIFAEAAAHQIVDGHVAKRGKANAGYGRDFQGRFVTKAQRDGKPNFKS
jgi:predicted DNA-binding protein (UPF0278 family)